MKRFGMPMGPLELLDQVGIDVAAHVAASMKSTLPGLESVAEQLAEMVERGRLGKKTKAGFYEYRKRRRGKALNWIAATEHPATQPAEKILGDLSYLQQRQVLPLINESARCLQESVVSQAWMMDLAMVLGTGFAPFHGGPLNLADHLGIGSVVAAMSNFQKLHGERYAPSEKLRELTAAGMKFRQSSDVKRQTEKAETPATESRAHV
jgi:3-hydroxyacyl-CoA dehydrogenase/enoyl-CoA hydratase/3-hydroxybutyryl-CoA epimerase